LRTVNSANESATGSYLDDVTDRLRAAEIPPDIIADAISCLPKRCQGLLMYGSRARRDHRPDSDLDLLAFVPRPSGSRSVGLVNLSCYTQEQLSTASGTLFGVHLQRDAIVVFDPEQKLTGLLANFAPLDAQLLLDRVQHFSAILSSIDIDQYLPGSVRLAKYFLRSAIYADAIVAGQPCFSVRELAERHSQSELMKVLDSGPQESATLSDLDDLIMRLEPFVGQAPPNPHSTIEALVVEEWETDRERSSLAILAMKRGSSQSPFDYSLLPKVLL